MTFDHSQEPQESPDAHALVAQIVGAFEQMPIPPGPSTRELIVHFERALDRPARSATPVLARLAGRWPIAIGGMSTLVALSILLWAFNSGRPLSAMERMAQRLREVKSYNYQLFWETVEIDQGKKQSTTWTGEGPVYWIAPDGFRDELTIRKIEQSLPDGPHREELLEHFRQVFHPGQPGILVDFNRKTYFKQPYAPTGSKTYPWETLRIIREGSATVLRDLGTRTIHGTTARGYLMKVRSPSDEPVLDPVEVWIDPTTDLPVELFSRSDEDSTTRQTRASDFRWNVTLDPKLFIATPPEGYTEVAPPNVSKPQ